jgi:ABC-type multidrug transport system fused ATPase/permease subunit
MTPSQDALFWLFVVCIIAAALTAVAIHSLACLLLNLRVSLHISNRVDWNPDNWQQIQQRLSRMRAEDVAQELHECLSRIDRHTSELVDTVFRQWAWQTANSILKHLVLLVILQMVVIICVMLLGWWNIAVAGLTWLTVAAIYGAAIGLVAVAVKRASNQVQSILSPNGSEESTASFS